MVFLTRTNEVYESGRILFIYFIFYLKISFHGTIFRLCLEAGVENEMK